MNKLLIANATVITMNDERSIFTPGWIGIAGSDIGYVGAVPPPDEWSGAEQIDATGCIALPGLINAHTHTGMTVMRGAADDQPLMEWLEQKIWPMEARMTAEDSYWGTRLAVLEMLRGGVTCLADMYWHSDQTARACSELGIRALLTGVLIGAQNDPDGQLARAERIVRYWNDRRDERIKFWFGPHAEYTCPRPYLETVVRLATELDVGIHIHVSETAGEVVSCQAANAGRSPVEILNEIGVFDRPTLAAHCIHLSDRDREILLEKGVSAVHNPSSSMKLAAGVMPVDELLDMGLNVALGTDSAASNNNLSIMTEMRMAALLQKSTSGNPAALPADRVLEMATRNGARALGWADRIGQLRTGFAADIVLVRTGRVHSTPLTDPVSHLVYCLHPEDVDTVFVAGEKLLAGGMFVRADASETLHQAQAIIERIRV